MGKKKSYIVFVLFALFMLFSCKGGTYTLSFYLVDNDPMSDTEGDYKLFATVDVPKGEYLKSFPISILHSGASGWYYGPLMKNLGQKLTADNIDQIQKDTLAQEFVPQYYNNIENEFPTRISGDYNLYACYGQTVNINFHYFKNRTDVQEGEAPIVEPSVLTIQNPKNSILDTNVISKEVMEELNKRVFNRDQVLMTEANYLRTNFAILNDGAIPADSIVNANLDYTNMATDDDGEADKVYSKISLSSITSSTDLDIYLLYAKEISITIMNWDINTKKYKIDVIKKEGEQDKERIISIGSGGIVSESDDPKFAGCYTWKKINNQGNSGAINSISEKIMTDTNVAEHNSALDDFSFNGTEPIYENITIFPVFVDNIEVLFRYYDGHHESSMTLAEYPSFSFKNVVSKNTGNAYSNFSIMCKPDNGYEINVESFPSENLLNDQMNIPRSDDSQKNKRDYIWDNLTSSMGAYTYDLKRDTVTKAIHWGQLIYSKAILRPTGVSSCIDQKVNDSSIVLLEELKKDTDDKNPKLRIVPNSKDNKTVYFYAISEKTT